jgi:hypothetical protein
VPGLPGVFVHTPDMAVPRSGRPVLTWR